MSYQIFKRVLDLTIAFLALIVLSPLFLVVMAILSVSGEKEIFYRQKRIGLNNTIFLIWKFATMLKNSEKMGTGSVTLRNDPRVTPIGKWLRMTKLNELPQIVNVVIGDISIVGPRPLVLADFDKYSENVKKIIYKVKPGITGIGSVVFRDEEKLLSVTQMDPHEFYRGYIAPYKGKIELWYQQHSSIANDLLIIFLTAWQIIFPNSNLAFRIFKDLPERPRELTIQGAKSARMELVAR